MVKSSELNPELVKAINTLTANQPKVVNLCFLMRNDKKVTLYCFRRTSSDKIEIASNDRSSPIDLLCRPGTLGFWREVELNESTKLKALAVLVPLPKSMTFGEFCIKTYSPYLKTVVKYRDSCMDGTCNLVVKRYVELLMAGQPYYLVTKSFKKWDVLFERFRSRVQE